MYNAQNELLQTFRYLMETKGHVTLRAEGNSMYPYIRPGDFCRFVPLEQPLRIGQIGLVASERGVLYSHRLLAVNRSATGVIYRFGGDLNRWDDEPVAPERVIGVLAELTRGTTVIAENRLLRRIWSRWAVRFRYGFSRMSYGIYLLGTVRDAIRWNGRKSHGFRNAKH